MDTQNDDPKDQTTNSDDTQVDPSEEQTEETDMEAVTEEAMDTAEEKDDEEKDTTNEEESAEPAKEETEEEEVMYATPDALNNPASQGVVPNAATNLINLESLINRHIGDIEKLKEQLKTQKDMFNDSFNNDATYAEHAEKVKELNRQKNAAKQKVLRQPALVAIAERIAELKDDMKDLQEALSSYLKQYQEISKTNQIVGENGEIHEIVTHHKLVKRGKGKP